MVQNVFCRREIKYLITSVQAEALVNALGDALLAEELGSTCIRNLYLDTPDSLLIRRSIEKPDYKEKLRVRAYGIGACSNGQPTTFLELKKKFEGLVYKRRIALSPVEVRAFVENPEHYTWCGAHRYAGEDGEFLHTQILRELAWTLKAYSPLQPFMNIDYERSAFTFIGSTGKENVRITMDHGIGWASGSWDVFSPEKDDVHLTQLLPQGECVLEIKALGAIPLELTALLTDLRIFPRSFSKVGKSYEACLEQLRSGGPATHRDASLDLQAVMAEARAIVVAAQKALHIKQERLAYV